MTTTTDTPAVEQDRPLTSHVESCRVEDLQPHPLSVELFGSLPEDQFAALKGDIEERGLQHWLEADAQRRIICGSQRLRAIQELEWDEVEILVKDYLKDEDEISRHLILDNVNRRHLSASQQYRAGVELERVESALAAKRQIAGGNQTPLRPDDRKGEATEIVAKTMGLSATTYKRIKQVFESGNDKVKDALDRGELSITAAAQKIRPPKLTTRKLAGDDPRAQALRFAKFSKEADGFEKWIKANQPAKFDAHEPEARTRLQRLSNRLQEALETAEQAA